MQVSVFKGLQFDLDLQLFGFRIQEKEFFKTRLTDPADRVSAKLLPDGLGEHFHGFDSRQDGLAEKLVIHPKRGRGQNKGDLFELAYFGKISHKRTVLASISTGVPAALVAQ